MAGNDLELALRIKADLQQAVGQLEAVEQQIEAVGNAAKDTTQSTSALSAATDKEAAAADRARQANAAAAQALRAQRQAQADSARNAADALKLFAQIDPVGNKLGKLDELESQLGKLHKAGAVSATDFKTFGDILQASRNKLTDAGKAVHTLGLNSSFARLEMARMGKDLATGQIGNFTRSAFTLAANVGVLNGVFTAAGLAIAGVTAGIVAYVAAVAAGEAQQHELETALIATGNVAGVTAGQMGAMRDRVGEATGEFGDAQKALIVLAQSGKVAGSELGDLGQAAVNLSLLTGESADKVAAEIAAIGDKPAETIAKLNEKYHFLTQATYEQIQALEDQGRAQEAARVATDALKVATDQRVDEMNAKAGTLARAWGAVKDAIHDAAQAAENIGRTDTEYLLQQAIAKRDAIARSLNTAHSYNGMNKDGLATPYSHSDLDAANADVAAMRAKSVGEQLAAQMQMFRQMSADAAIQGDAAAAAMTKQLQRQLDLKNAITEVDKVQLEIQKGSLKNASKQMQDQALAKARALDAANAAKKGGASSGGLGIDRAQLGADVAAYRQAWSDANKAFSNAERQLEAQRKADLVDDASYFEQKQQHIDSLRDAQITALEQERGGLLAHATTAAQRIRIDQQVKDIDAKIEQAKQDAAAKTEELQAQQTANARQRAEQWSQLQAAYYNAIGQPEVAQMLSLQAEHAKTLAEMEQAANVAGKRMAQDLFNVRAAQIQLDGIQRAADFAFSQIDLASQHANADQQAGLISELQARQATIDANLRYADALEKAAKAATELALKTRNPNDIEHAQQLVEKVRELRLVTSALGQEVQGTLSDSFSTFLQNVFTRAESVKQAFGDLLKSIAQGLAKIAADDISQRLFSGVQSLFNKGAGGGAGAAGAAQLASAAGATAAAGTTIGVGAAALTTAAAALDASAGSLITAAAALGAANAGSALGGKSSGGLLGYFSSLFSDSKGLAAAASAFGFAAGGPVAGPGTGTSDSILARVSNGEFVANAAAVKHYGVGMLASINERRFPRFADGGFVGLPPVRTMADVGRAHQSAPKSLKVVPVFDPSQIASATAGRAGEQVFVMHFKNNIPQLRAMLGAR